MPNTIGHSTRNVTANGKGAEHPYLTQGPKGPVGKGLKAGVLRTHKAFNTAGPAKGLWAARPTGLLNSKGEGEAFSVT